MKKLFKDSEETKKIDEIVKTLPSNVCVCNTVLTDIMKIDKVKVVEEEKFKNSYYNAITNTITLSGNEKKKNHISRIMISCHECVHAKQSKILHYINFIFSNIELILFFIYLIVLIFGKINDVAVIIYNSIAIIGITVRVTLELHAVIKSVSLSKEYLDTKISKEDSDKITKRHKTMALIMIIPFFISLLFMKIIRIVAINYINIIR